MASKLIPRQNEKKEKLSLLPTVKIDINHVATGW